MIKMKTLVLFFVIILAVQVFGQRHDRFRDRPNKRIEELHKIKLIESLQMDEETTLKFFSRHAKHKEEMRNRNDKSVDLLDQMEEKLKNGKTEEAGSLVEAYLKNEKNIADERDRFINSLSDILTREQLARFLVFEQRFREEIRDIILKERRQRRN